MSGPDMFQWAPMPRLRVALNETGLFAAGPVTFSRAPGRLDVMGGIADYSGSLVCEMPLEVAAGAAVQARQDGNVVCRSAQSDRTVRVPMAAVTVTDPKAVRQLFAGDDAWARYVAGCVWWLGRLDPALASKYKGVTILVDSDVPLGGGVSSSAAIEVATMSALAALWKVPLSPMQLAAACQQVENLVVGAPCGVMDQVTSAMGERGTLLSILCQPDAVGLPAQVRGPVKVPDGFAFIGVHSGVRHEVSGDPYTDTRIAAFMGQKILSKVDPSGGDFTGGHLANVPTQRFTAELRDKLPSAIRGDMFLAAHGESNDKVTTIDPKKEYHVRAATEHHVLEPWRVETFVACLNLVNARSQATSSMLNLIADFKAGRAFGANDPSGKAFLDKAEQRFIEPDRAPAEADLQTLIMAGDLMYQSHKSYGECARLGHPMTDRLVEMVKQRGPDRGFFGAKITGGGGGGTVAMLIRDRPEVREEVEKLRGEYERETGRQTMLFAGSSPGAAAMGTATLKEEEWR
jgi:galactokinase